MRITRVRIKNFRCIKDLDLALAGTTVLIGPNNAGKTAVLEALRIALTRRWGLRGTGFTEYDCHLDADGADPRTAPPISIEVELAEGQTGEWSDDLTADLAEIIQVDPNTGRGIIILRVSCPWDPDEGAFAPKWEFLNSERKPMRGKGARVVNTHPFFEYVPTFYLDALRDADDEFSSRSQFWGRLLRAVTIPESLSNRVQQVLDRVNRRLLGADPKITNIADTLGGIGEIATEEDPGAVAIRMAPFKTWDLISRAEVIIQTTEERPWLPVGRHGRGVQSLSVIFLFHAFVSELLAGLFQKDSSAFLLLEEPETHLHPQAARTLWRHVSKLPGQALVTTHSPYFVQHVPFRDLRLIRIGANGTTYCALPKTFDADLPEFPQLTAYLSTLSGEVTYDAAARRLVVTGKLRNDIYQRLRTLYSGHESAPEALPLLDRLYKRSQSFVEDDVLQDLELYGRRIRGEIFFARKWLLVEGQSEYLVAHAIGDALGVPLDAYGIAVIDFQNCGNLHSFALAARALEIPWVTVVDGDPEGQEFPDKLAVYHFTPGEIAAQAYRHAERNLEAALAVSSEPLLRRACLAAGIQGANTMALEELLVRTKKKKIPIAVTISELVRNDPAMLDQLPPRFVAAVRAITEKAA